MSEIAVCDTAVRELTDERQPALLLQRPVQERS
jgi:hypothetical protein